ncbi:MAG: zinc-ribbon domain-containing protein [Alphaproteobacteria bacterium]|nr:zinc-ribbon domain-containing protein [Alphaproteobacteria bacterium]
MLISCPKCNAVYQIPEGKIPEVGKKFKCAECGEVWTVYPKDVKKMAPETTVPPAAAPAPSKSKKTISTSAAPQLRPQAISPQTSSNSDVDAMFNRLSQDTKGLFSGNGSSDTKLERYKRKIAMFFTPFMINCCLFLLIIAFTFYIGYANRFYIVSKIPQLEHFYNEMGIKSLHEGRGLIFKNIKSRYLRRHDENFVEISGLVYNESDMKSAILPIKAELYSKTGDKLAESVKVLTLDRLEPSFSAVFRILLPDNDSLEDKSIKLSFDKNANI